MQRRQRAPKKKRRPKKRRVVVGNRETMKVDIEWALAQEEKKNGK